MFLKYICILSLLFLMRLTKGFVYFIYRFKKAALGFVEKVNCFAFSMSLIYYLHFCTFLFILLLLFSITEFFNPFLHSHKWTEAIKFPLSVALATVNKAMFGRALFIYKWLIVPVFISSLNQELFRRVYLILKYVD